MSNTPDPAEFRDVAVACHKLNEQQPDLHRFDITTHVCHYCGLARRDFVASGHREPCRRTMHPAPLGPLDTF